MAQRLLEFAKQKRAGCWLCGLAETSPELVKEIEAAWAKGIRVVPILSWLKEEYGVNYPYRSAMYPQANAHVAGLHAKA